MWDWAKAHPVLFTVMTLGIFWLGTSVLRVVAVVIGLLCGIQINW